MKTKASEHIAVVIATLAIGVFGALGTNIGAYASMRQVSLQERTSEREAHEMLLPSGAAGLTSDPLQIMSAYVSSGPVQSSMPLSIAQRYPNCERDARTDPEQLFPPSADDGEDRWAAYCTGITIRRMTAEGTELTAEPGLQPIDPHR